VPYSVRSDLPRDTDAPEGEVDVRVEHSLTLAARDGTILTLDLLAPRAQGAYPVVLIRTPYDKVAVRELQPGTKAGLPYDYEFLMGLVTHGYVVAIQDVRGRFNSDGEWHPYVHEQEDGFDTVEWIVDQPWCDGNVGMVGRSYVGYVQWAAAAQRPRGLKAIVPIGAQPDLFVSGFPMLNGVFNLPMSEMVVAMGRRSFQIRDFMSSVMDKSHDYFRTLPIAAIPRAAGGEPPSWWHEMMQHPTRDEYWRRGAYVDALEEIEVAAMNVSGWYDLTLHGALENYRRVHESGAEHARTEQRLVMGPWAHWADVSAARDGVDFGERAVGGLGPYITRFFDRWLKGVDNGLDGDDRAHVFAMGANEWWSAPKWPFPGTEFTPFYLHADGRLSTDAPGDEGPDTYRHDPENPVEGAWSMHNGPVDDRGLADRPDVLTYTTDLLAQPLDVAGPLTFVLHASSSARDTDWHVRLVDVHPDGYAQFLAHGVLRARFRESFAEPSLLTPGRVERYEIDLTGTANRFLPGHRIRVEIASSWFPRYERNLGGGADNPFFETDAIVAEQTIFHDAARASWVVLPLV
jgi:putative CocE/NonD family hydrolase